MSADRTFRTFTHRQAVLRICCDRYVAATAEIVRQRKLLDRYIATHPGFKTAFEPIALHAGAPEIARRMARAAQIVGVGPMAAVAGAMAQRAAEAAMDLGSMEAIVENGGDIYVRVAAPVTIGLDSGTAKLGARLAFVLEPRQTPLAICSSSGLMGHSTSLGRCDLATVVAHDAALADAAATFAANLVRRESDIDMALGTISALDGIDGLLIVKNERIGLAGRLPKLVKRK